MFKAKHIGSLTPESTQCILINDNFTQIFIFYMMRIDENFIMSYVYINMKQFHLFLKNINSFSILAKKIILDHDKMNLIDISKIIL